MMQTTPSRMKLLLENENCVEGLQKVTDIMIGGEAFPKKLLKDLAIILKKMNSIA